MNTAMNKGVRLLNIIIHESDCREIVSQISNACICCWDVRFIKLVQARDNKDIQKMC